jgi:hypothetical protein
LAAASFEARKEDDVRVLLIDHRGGVGVHVRFAPTGVAAHEEVAHDQEPGRPVGRVVAVVEVR